MPDKAKFRFVSTSSWKHHRWEKGRVVEAGELPGTLEADLLTHGVIMRLSDAELAALAAEAAEADPQP